MGEIKLSGDRQRDFLLNFRIIEGSFKPPETLPNMVSGG